MVINQETGTLVRVVVGGCEHILGAPRIYPCLLWVCKPRKQLAAGRKRSL